MRTTGKKKNIIILFIVFLISISSTADVNAAIPTTNDHPDMGVYIFEENTNSILYAQNEDEKMYPASTTKILTAIVVIENIENLDLEITVSNELTLTPLDSSLANIEKGEVFKYIDLLYGLMLYSGNDAALTLATNVGRVIANDETLTYNEAIEVFISKMNETATKVGMTSSNFENPHGYHDDNHYTTAVDMMTLARYAMENDTFKTIVGTNIHTVTTNKKTHTYKNSNILVADNINGQTNQYYYEYATGIKTGYTIKANRCLVFSSEKDGKFVIGVIFNHESQQEIFTLSKEFLEYGNEETVLVEAVSSKDLLYEIKIDNSSLFTSGILKVETLDDISLYIDQSNSVEEITMEFTPDSNLLTPSGSSEGKYSIINTIEKEDVIGYITLSTTDKVVGEFPVYAKNKVAIFTDFDLYTQYVLLFIVAICLIYMLFSGFANFKKARRRRKIRIQIKRRHKINNRKK